MINTSLHTIPADSSRQLKAILFLIAVTINIFEVFIPRIPLFPWLKPGLANCVTILWIIRFGGKDAVLFTLLRIWIAGFYFGFSFLTFTLAASGGILSTVTMSVMWQSAGKKGVFGLVGIGIAGALTHNAGQLIAVYLLIARNVLIFYQIPLMILASVLFGTFVSLLVIPLNKRLMAIDIDSIKNIQVSAKLNITGSDAVISISAFLFSMSLVFINSLKVVLLAALFITMFVQILEKGSVKALIHPIKSFWMLFVAVSALHLFFSYGKRIDVIPFITHEGLDNALLQSARLWAWLQIAAILKMFKFHILLIIMLEKLFGSHRDTLDAGMLALEVFPHTIKSAGRNASAYSKLFFKHPLRWASTAIDNTIKDSIASMKEYYSAK